MKVPLTVFINFMLVLFFIPVASYAQVTLLSENFNDCTIPSDWTVNVIGDGTPFYDVGMPSNSNADGSSIDGSCMLIFDDDATGDNTPPYVIEVISGVFDGSQSPIIQLDMDVHFRSYEGSTLKLKVFDGTNYHVVKSWSDEEGTGQQFSEFESVTFDLSFYASPTMQLILEYDDNGTYGWWAGVDNIVVTGLGSGTNVVLETFNDCSLPSGWETQIQEGDENWQFGYIDNGNADVTSMNGTCFAFFDDDGLGENADFSNVLLVSPVFSGSEFASFTLNFDLILRKYAPYEELSVWVWDGTESHLVQTFSDDVGGPQFDVFENINLDLSVFRTQSMQVIFSYSDGQDWGWWVGIDNVKITGEGQINDLCANATDLTTGANCISGNNLTAIFEGSQPACTDNNIGGLWYSYVPDFTGILKISTQADFNDVITIYSGTCSAPVEMDCTNRDEFGFIGESLFMDVNSDTQYFIRVSGLDQTFGIPRGQLCIAAEQVPAYPELPDNDICSSAIAVQVGDDCISGNNLNASFDGPEPSLNLKSRADIWYSFEAIDTAEIEILTNADFADVITLYRGSCGALTEMACNEFGQSLKTSGLTIGENYYIQVAGFFASLEGNVCLTVKEVTTEVADNDLCIDATTLILGETCIPGSNIAANFDGPVPGCEIFNAANIWYQFTAPASGGVKINTGAEFVHTVAIYSGDCNNMEELICMENPTPCEGFFDVEDLEPGETYFMQIASELNPFGFLEGSFCIEILDITDTVTEPLALTVDVNCIDDGLGQLQISASGGMGAYTFFGNTESDTLANGVEYFVVLKDENNCEVSLIGTVTCGEIPCVLNTNLMAENVTCYGGNNGQASVEVLDGSAPYTYNWSHGATTASVNALSAGFYTVTIQDETGCPAILQVEISQPDIFQVNISSTGESDIDANDGSANSNPMGGTPPFSYLWSNGETSQNLENLSPGIYAVTVTDANGCEQTESVVISDFECALALDLVVQEISCSNANDGYIEVYPMGGTAPFSYEWNTGATSDVVSNLGPGTYTVTVLDANNCPRIENITFIQPTALTFETDEVIPADCFGNDTGSATLLAAGGTAPYTFSWPDGSTGSFRNNLTAGTYMVTLTDDHDCTQTSEIEITQPEELMPVSINTQHVSCFGGNDGIATVLVNGGTSPFTYQWDDANNQTSAQATGLSPGTYTVQVTDYNACAATTTVTVNEPNELMLSVDALFNETNNAADGSIQVTVSGGTTPYSYQWYLNGNLVSNEEDPTNLINGSYTLTIVDAMGCELNSSSIVLENIVGISDPDLEQLVSIMPNPSSGKFMINIELQNEASVSFIITDVLGRVLFTGLPEQILLKTIEVDLSEYPSGTYPLKVIIDDKLVLKKVILQK